MGESFTIQIPTKPYLKKYIQTLYGRPVIFTRENNFGMAVLAFLDEKRYFRHDKKLVHKAFDKFDDKIEIHFPRWWKDRSKFNKGFSEQSVVNINKLFEEQMESHLSFYCRTRNVEIRSSLYDFCFLHSIEIDIDITYEALKQKEYRTTNNLPEDYILNLTRLKSINVKNITF